MKFSRTRRAAFAAAAIAPFIALAATSSAVAETTLERVRKDGYIRVGFANEAPFGFATPDGKLTGEAPEVAKAVFAKMGIEQVDGVLTEFGSLIPGLKAGRFDVIAAGMFITPQRCAEINFSEPSYGIGQAMLVEKGNPKGIEDYSSFKADTGLKLAVMSGAVERGYAKDAGIAESQVVSLPDQASLVAAVQSKRADAAALTALSIAGMAKKVDGLESTKPFDEVAGASVKGHGGFGFRKADAGLLKAFNEELAKFVGFPEHIKLVEPFGFGKDYLPNQTAADLCTSD
ncbi:MAG: ectoine/hydroxyectoine ABC transporter substrate-binding protein EhuB [Rhizobiaceae bacterium]